MRPSEYEFSGKTKGAALYRAKYQCEKCQARQDDGYHLEVHHVLGIAYALRYYPSVPAALIRSMANARVLCSDCHVEADNRLRFDHPEVAAILLGLYIPPYETQGD